jgi:hypothetical protein
METKVSSRANAIHLCRHGVWDGARFFQGFDSRFEISLRLTARGLTFDFDHHPLDTPSKIANR